MAEVWAGIVIVILFLVIYGMISSRLDARKKRKLREQTLPKITDYPKTGIQYNVYMSDGRKFLNVKLLGSVEAEDATFTFAGYEGMLVIEQSSGKKAYLKKSSVRYIEEI